MELSSKDSPYAARGKRESDRKTHFVARPNSADLLVAAPVAFVLIAVAWRIAAGSFGL
jgi:hypothetical protein